MWFSHFQSRKSSIGLLAWKRSDNLKFHTSLHSAQQPSTSRQWGAECLCPDITRHLRPTGGCCFVIVVWWCGLACVVHSCQVGYWQVGNCGYRLHAINCWILLPTCTYLLLWCQSIFKRSQNSLLSAAMMWNAICNTTTTKKEMGLLIEPNSHSQIPILCHYRLYRYVQ